MSYEFIILNVLNGLKLDGRQTGTEIFDFWGLFSGNFLNVSGFW